MLQEMLCTDGTVTFGEDYTCLDQNGDALPVPKGKTVTLDLNGLTIDRILDCSSGPDCVINVCGIQTVSDSVGSGRITGSFLIPAADVSVMWKMAPSFSTHQMILNSEIGMMFKITVPGRVFL